MDDSEYIINMLLIYRISRYGLVQNTSRGESSFTVLNKEYKRGQRVGGEGGIVKLSFNSLSLISRHFKRNGI